MKFLINKSEIRDLIPKDGKIFTVIFLKQDGTIRKLTGRKGVKKYATGDGLRFNPDERGLFVMFEMRTKSYRLINFNGMQRMKINKVEYEIIVE
jgi:hypothetical protein